MAVGEGASGIRVISKGVVGCSHSNMFGVTELGLALVIWDEKA